MGLNDALTNEYKKRGQNRIDDIRSEVYDISEEAAQEVIEAGFVDYILEEADYAIELAKQNNADYAVVRFQNYVIDDDAIYPGEDNVGKFDTDADVIADRTSIANMNGARLLYHVLDRGEYKNYFVEDFAPALAIAGAILSEEGYEIDPYPEQQLGSFAQKMLVRLFGLHVEQEIYLDVVNISTSSAFTLCTHFADLRIKL